MASVPNKRTQLLKAASRVLHEQGFANTTLADVASRAKVPLGNVYYYFKTKDSLAQGVIANHEAWLCSVFASLVEKYIDPRERLHKLITTSLDPSHRVIQYGCPHGSLCQELEKLGPGAPLAIASSRLLRLYLKWVEEQFRELGFGAEAPLLAADLVAALQGTILISHSLNSRPVLARQLRRVAAWLDALPPPRPSLAGSSLAGPSLAGRSTRRARVVH